MAYYKINRDYHINHINMHFKDVYRLMDFKIKGKELFEKEVKPHGNGAKVLIPKKYIGRKVVVVVQ